MTSATKETEVWGQPLLAPHKAGLSMCDLVTVFTPWWLFCKAGNSLWGQTPVGTEHLELLGLGRKKTSLLVLEPGSDQVSSTKETCCGILENARVMSCGFLCLIRKSELGTCCAVPFWAIGLAEVGGKRCKEPSASLLGVLGCSWEICSTH